MGRVAEYVILQGGPRHGMTLGVSEGTQTLHVPYITELPPVEINSPRHRWWHRLLRRPVWVPPDPPTYKNLVYRRVGDVFRYDGDA